MQRKLTKKDVQYRRKKGELLTKPLGLINGESFVMRNLSKCNVYVPGHFSTVYIDDCFDSEIRLGPIESSVFIRDCKNCTISVAAQQVRVSTSSDLMVKVYSATDLTLEKVTNLKLGPYNFIYPNICQHFKNSLLSGKNNKGFTVMDFDVEYKQTEKTKNYKIINEIDFKGFEVFIPDLIDPKNSENIITAER